MTEHVHEKIFSGEKYALPGCWFWICATCPATGHTEWDPGGKSAAPKIESIRYFERLIEVSPESSGFANNMLQRLRSGRNPDDNSEQPKRGE